MEGLANRTQTHMLPTPQQNITGPGQYAAISIQQTQQERMPPTYEEAQLAVQAVDIQQITNLEAEKQAIYRHPLLPLLAKLFEKCEQSTQTCELTPANAFDNEIKNGILQMNREGKSFYTEDRDLDNLVSIVFLFFVFKSKPFPGILKTLHLLFIKLSCVSSITQKFRATSTKAFLSL